MLLRRRLCAHGPVDPEPEIPLPLTIELPGGGTATLKPRERPGDYVLTIDQRVDPSGLELMVHTRFYRTTPDGERIEQPQVRVSSTAVAGEYEGDEIFDALSLLTDAAFNRYGSLDEPTELIPESAGDAALLDSEFGTREVFRPTGVTHHGRTFHEPITPDLVAALLPRRAGLQIYSEALRLSRPQARYRDFWRVLESAFGRKGQDLLKLLAEFPPLHEIGASLAELQELYAYRGRASHAESRSGIIELRRVRAFTMEREGRLKCFAERVLMTKHDWGSQSLAVDELAQLRSWIGPARHEESGT